MIEAYETPLSCMKMNFQVNRIVVGSHQNAVIKIFDVKTSELLQEVWRGKGIS